MTDNDIIKVISVLKEKLEIWGPPVVSSLSDGNHSPFQILISTLLSLRTKDEITAIASNKLFSLSATPDEMLRLSEEEIIRAIYPVGFYRNKTKTILHICRELVDRYESRVPDTPEELLTLKGVGRKTANLVAALAYNRDEICVDIHVHRISNRLGYVKTKNPEETEYSLRKRLPKKYWSLYNTLMVAFGKNICRPISPFCSRCPVSMCCERVGVIKSR
jgi:endonuclease-3